MDKTLLLMLALAATICILGTAGCISNSTTSLSTVQAAGQNPTVSFNATPVKYAQVNGVTLGYREFGSGEPLLMIEGFGATIDDWNETFIGILATNYHVYTYDNRGMGYSSDNNATPTISLYSDDAAAMMTALGYDSMNVYGASMGSSISQQLAIDHPERVRKLILDSNTYSVRIPQTQKLLGTIESVVCRPGGHPGRTTGSPGQPRVERVMGRSLRHPQGRDACRGHQRRPDTGRSLGPDGRADQRIVARAVPGAPPYRVPLRPCPVRGKCAQFPRHERVATGPIIFFAGYPGNTRVPDPDFGNRSFEDPGLVMPGGTYTIRFAKSNFPGIRKRSLKYPKHILYHSAQPSGEYGNR